MREGSAPIALYHETPSKSPPVALYHVVSFAGDIRMTNDKQELSTALRAAVPIVPR